MTGFRTSIALPVLAALAFCACAGASFTLFAAHASETGTIEGTDQGGPIDYEGGGPIFGAAVTFEATTEAARRSVVRQYDAEPDRYDDEHEPAPTGGFDFNGPLAYGIYSMVAIVGIIAKAIFGTPAQTPPQE